MDAEGGGGSEAAKDRSTATVVPNGRVTAKDRGAATTVAQPQSGGVTNSEADGDLSAAATAAQNGGVLPSEAGGHEPISQPPVQGTRAAESAEDDEEPAGKMCDKDAMNSAEQGDSNINDRRERDVVTLQSLCGVLGIKFKEKMKEIMYQEGDAGAHSRLLDQIRMQEKEKRRRFFEIKEHGRELIKMWKSSMEPLSKTIRIRNVYAVVDANSADEVTGDNLLSSTAVTGVVSEVLLLKTRIRNKHDKVKKKLLNLIKQTHLTPREIHFEPNRHVDDDELGDEIQEIKSIINRVKKSVMCRKDLVFRMESIDRAINELWPPQTIKELIELARKSASEITSTSTEELLYNGDAIDAVLSYFCMMAGSVHNTAVDQKLQKTSGAAPRYSKTRSGARFRAIEQTPLETVIEQQPVPKQLRTGCIRKQGATSVCEAQKPTDEAEWSVRDKRRIRYFAYHVSNIERTIQCYKDVLGMTLHHRKEYPEAELISATLGFGPSATRFTFNPRCAYKRVKKLEIGEAIGHFSVTNNDVHRLGKKVEESSFSNIIRQPGTIDGGSELFLFARDNDGYLFEVVQRDATQKFCKLMLYVSNLDRSIAFYEKALGMKLLQKKQFPQYSYNMATVGYADDDSIILELRCDTGIDLSKKGNAFIELGFSTENLKKSAEELKLVIEPLGGKMLPGTKEEETRFLCFLDPDGWEVMMRMPDDP